MLDDVDRHLPEPGRGEVRVLLAQTGVEVERHARDLGLEIRADEQCPGLFCDVADRTVVEREIEAAGVCGAHRSEEHTSELQSLMRISYAVFCLKKKKKN